MKYLLVLVLLVILVSCRDYRCHEGIVYFCGEGDSCTPSTIHKDEKCIPKNSKKWLKK